jgi:hypothetical protein
MNKSRSQNTQFDGTANTPPVNQTFGGGDMIMKATQVLLVITIIGCPIAALADSSSKAAVGVDESEAGKILGSYYIAPTTPLIGQQKEQ